jgi:hypothetical protein
MFVVWILRTLVASGFLDEVGEYEYPLTPREELYFNEAQADNVIVLYVHQQEVVICCKNNGLKASKTSLPVSAYPQYLKSIKPAQPKSTTGRLSQETWIRIFDYLYKHPGKQALFASSMRAALNSAAEDAESVGDSYEKDLVGTTSGEIDIVDVGVGRGHYLQVIVNRNPDAKGRFVNQDLKACLDTVFGPTTGVELMTHDFFTPQPLKGKPHSTVRDRPLTFG